MMPWFKWIALLSTSFCLFAAIFHLVRLIRLGRPKDFAPAAGTVREGVIYSFTAAMSPVKKESAFLHLPTYTAGMVYHAGTFLCMLLYFLILTGIPLPRILTLLISGFLLISSGCGTGIWIKRFVKKELRNLSNPDDYLSNLLVTLFQATTLAVLNVPRAEALYFIAASALQFYFPFGKLKHAIYFFAARYQLGYFFGLRGVWPTKTMKES